MMQAPSVIHTTTKDAWDSMIESCEAALETIDIEQYIFCDDRIGRRFLEILKRKAGEGVRVRLLIDTAGSFSFYQSSIPDDLKKVGIQVRFFNIISPWRIHNFFSWVFRNHKKTLVVDGRIAHTGGTGIGEHMGSWRDTTGKVEGEVVREITDSFLEMWELAVDRNFLSKLKRWKAYKKKIEFLTNAPYFKKRFLYDAIVGALENAKKSISITNPYFIPNHKIKRILRKAAMRGIEVRIIVPEKIDVPIVATASNSSFDELLRSGVRIFKYKTDMLHAKTIVVDGNWATYGSFNLDGLSFFYNYEANIVTTSEDTIEQLESHFDEDLRCSEEVLERVWERRPLLRKIQEFLIAPLRNFL